MSIETKKEAVEHKDKSNIICEEEGIILFLSLNMFKIHCMSNVHVCLLCLCPVADGGVLVGPVRVDVDDPLYHLFDDVTGQQCAT